MVQQSRFSFTVDEEGQGQRLAYRANVNGIEARLNKGADVYNVVDLSVTGCAFQVPKKILSENQTITLQLEVRQRVILADIRAIVIRSTSQGIVACNFLELTERQEYALDKLVLEIQKRIIEVNKL